MIAPQDNSTPTHESLVEPLCKPYWGKYRGTVFNNIDPKSEGRVQVMVPDISIKPLINWAILATPIGGIQSGMFAVPPIGSGVWVEFEAGELSRPICTGCFWGSQAEVPKLGLGVHKPFVDSLTMQTKTQSGITISDLPAGDTGGIQIQTASGSRISVTQGQVKIQNGAGSSIKMIGPLIEIDASVIKFNGSALVITK